MFKFRLIAVGKFKNTIERELFDHYNARLSPQIELIELAEPVGEPKTRQQKLLTILQKRIDRPQQTIALDETGAIWSSKQLSREVDALASDPITFLIGGADGLPEPILKQCRHYISFGKVTWPHLLMRGLLAEQLYRAVTLINGHPYHRE